MAQPTTERREQAKRILLVEDEWVTAMGLKVELESLGYAVCATVDTAEDAIVKAAELLPDLILMDIVLNSPMSGIEAAAAIRQSHDIPVVYLTAYSDPETIAKARTTEPYGYLPKPCSAAIMMTTIEVALYKSAVDKGRRRLEAQLQEAHKLEAVGILAGGIAHDYNNLLTVILGNIELAEEDALAGRQQGKYLRRAKEATMLATALTRKFLTFSAGGTPAKKVIGLGEFVEDIVTVALSGSNVRCDFVLADDLWLVEIDPGQMSQVIGNIVTNAREAMPDGGCIRLSAQNLSVEQMTQETGLDGKGNCFVKIAVADQGKGISKGDLGSIFDPYFSTKERGEQKGMGLGLTIASVLVKKHGGHLQVQSEEGRGTTVLLYLPALTRQEAEVSSALMPDFADNWRG